jgi:hypothetical protein
MNVLKTLELFRNECINEDYTPHAHVMFTKIERDLRECSLSYLYFENQEIRVTFTSKLENINRTLSKFSAEFDKIESLLGNLSKKFEEIEISGKVVNETQN